MSIKLTAPETYTATIGGVEWSNITVASYMWAEVQDRIAAGEEVIDLTVPSEPSPEEQIAAFRNAVQAQVDATANERKYDSGLSCVSYVGDDNPQYHAEAVAFRTWRSSVWTTVTAQLDQILVGKAEPPENPAALIASLPKIDWPDED